MDLRDRVAVVVGGGGDIGVAVARRFAAEGARLVLAEDSAPSPARPAAASAGDPAAAETIALDLASEEEVRDAIARTIAGLGGIDVLVNVGEFSEGAGPDEPGPLAWQQRLRHLTSCACWCRAAAPAMRARGRGRIVNIAASAGRYRSAWLSSEGAGSGAAVAAAAGGVLALTRELAFELGPDGVTVNAVVPGWIRTAGSERAWQEMSARAREHLLAEISLGRPGRADEVAGAVLFLASEASSYVSGIALDVNGGWWMS